MIDPRDPDYENTPASPRRPQYGYAPEGVDPHRPPAVSILTSTCHAGPVFRETVRSILAQTLQDWEWLIVDDGSEDAGVRELLYEVMARDPRIRVLEHAENRGLGAGRNTALEQARAPYVYLIDDDDLIEPTTLEKCLWHLDTHPGASFVNGWSIGFGAQQYLWRRGFDEGDAFLDDNWVTGRAMLRTDALRSIGGYDESMRAGFEDWDVWVRLARAGHWGETLPEFMDWYRRRPTQDDRWRDFERNRGRVRARLRAAHPTLRRRGFPHVAAPEERPFAPPERPPPCENRLAPGARRILFLVPWLDLGGADKFNLDVVAGLRQRGFEITIVTTLEGASSWEHGFARHTPDVFHLHHFLPLDERARFLRYLIGSRRPEAVVVTHSELGYLFLPYLRTHCPDPVYVDYTHIEEEGWKGGGYPRMAIHAEPHLDAHLVSSAHLRDWMARHGAARDAISVLHTGVDCATWQPDDAARRRLRAAWEVDEDTAVILYSGRICRQKQPEVLARTAAALQRRGCDFLLVVAGDGEEMPALERELSGAGLHPDHPAPRRRRRWRRPAAAREDGAGSYRDPASAGPVRSRVLLLGAVSNDAVRDLMSAADVFFLPSRWEGIALSIYEAMAMELAVVTADVGGQAELVVPGAGVLVERSDVDTEVKAYADALERLIAEPAARRALARAARLRVAEAFPLERMRDGFVERLERARSRRDAQRGAAHAETAGPAHAPAAAGPPGPALSPEIARAALAQAIEYLRAERRAEALWRASYASHPPGEPPLRDDLWLEHVEGAWSWRVMKDLHRGPLGRLARRLGLARDLDRIDAIVDPSARRAAIEASRSYRLIRAVKATPVHRLYAQMRHGPRDPRLR